MTQQEISAADFRKTVGRRAPVYAKGRAIKALERSGHLVADVETRIPHTHITRDMFECFDLVAIHPAPAMHGQLRFVQVTDKTHAAHRRKKVLTTPAARILASISISISVELWLWDPKRQSFDVEDLSATLRLGLSR